MAIDPSALLATLQDEPDLRAFYELIAITPSRRLSTAGFVKLSIVIEAHHSAEGICDLDLFPGTAGVELVSFDAGQAQPAREGFRRFGNGRHPAGVNVPEIIRARVGSGEVRTASVASFPCIDCTVEITRPIV